MTLMAKRCGLSLSEDLRQRALGYEPSGHPPKEYTPKQAEKWVKEQAILFEREVQDTPEPSNRSITLAKYIEHWEADIGPKKLADSTYQRDLQDIRRILSLIHIFLPPQMAGADFVVPFFQDKVRYNEYCIIGGICMPVLKLTPTCKDYLWGGSRLRTDFGIKRDLEPLAEAWVLSCHQMCIRDRPPRGRNRTHGRSRWSSAALQPPQHPCR